MADAPTGGAPAGGASLPPRGSHSRSSLGHGSPPSPIRRFFSSIFGMCRDIQVRQRGIESKKRKEREARRKDTRTLKQLATQLELDPHRSPLSDGAVSAASEPETEE